MSTRNIDVARIAGLVRREVRHFEREGRAASVVVASRVYATDVDDLWHAVTSKERIPRWFLPIEGELQLNGRFQFKDNAGGTITACAAPTAVSATWEFGGDTSWIAVTLAAEAKGTRLTLEHTAFTDNPHFAKYGPGAVGIGWDMGLLGLHLYIEEGGNFVTQAEAMAWAMSDNGKSYQRQSNDGWCDADVKAGRAASDARDRADNTIKAYLGEA